MKILEKIHSFQKKIPQIDSIAVGVVDFNKSEYSCFKSPDEKLFFDLASLTKPLTLALFYQTQGELFSEKMKLLLNHRGSLPSGGRTEKKKWRSVVGAYKIKESETCYSDYSALKLQLEIEKNINPIKFKDVCEKFWDKEIIYWKDLGDEMKSPISGTRGGKNICGEVHDDNAYNIGEFTSHAGLFGTIEGVCRTLINFNQMYDLLSKMEISLSKSKQQYIDGWDRVTDLKDTFAGIGASNKTFGHLGFTGTSIWIDCEKKMGHVILANATNYAFYDKNSFNIFRKDLAKTIWDM